MNEPTKHERAIVIFDSKFGNTGEVAKYLANGLQKAGVETTCQNFRDVQTEQLQQFDLIAVGAPTQAFTASVPIKEFLKKLDGSDRLRGKRGFAFDTKLGSPLSGSASKFIEKKLSQLGMEILRPRESAVVKKSEGPLEEGESSNFESIGFDLGTRLNKTESTNPGGI